MAASLLWAAPVSALVENPDLDTGGSYLYDVRADEGRVVVTVDLSITADKPNQSVRGGYRQFYFDGYLFPIPAEAEDVVVTDGAGRDLEFDRELDSDLVHTLVIEFRRNLLYRQTAEIQVSYSLSSGAPRSDNPTRVNPAYVALDLWTAPLLEEAEVKVILPNGFESNEGFGEILQRQRVDGVVHFDATDVDPEDFWAYVSIANTEALESHEIELDGFAVTVRSWPGDSQWADTVTTTVEEALPELIELVGEPWPSTLALTIRESYSPTLAGYGGWYDEDARRIEIGEDVDERLVLHELGHVWFNDSLFDQRWITEGLADEFAAHVVENRGGADTDPPPTSLLDASARSLNRWSRFMSDPEDEEWGYNASWTVMHAIAEEVGFPTIAAAVASAEAGTIPYEGGLEPEPGQGRHDWRFLLDLLENHGSVTDDAVRELFEEWVLTDSEARELEARGESRVTYFDLMDAAGDWAIPVAVRLPMSNWDFDEADELMADAAEILDGRDQLVVDLEVVGAALPDSVETAFESAEDGFTETTETLEDVAAAAGEIGTAHELATASPSLFERVGLLGVDLDAELGDAIEAFEAGDLDRSGDEAAEIEDLLELADRDGKLRVGAVAGGVVILLLLVLVWRQRRRRRLVAADAADDATLDEQLAVLLTEEGVKAESSPTGAGTS
ncbi:MAG: M1 family metallopeptidase [Actinomycetia bacterium]|nr:M1 family metallopeptidase [Actinomycetes bacterium]